MWFPAMAPGIHHGWACFGQQALGGNLCWHARSLFSSLAPQEQERSLEPGAFDIQDPPLDTLLCLSLDAKLLHDQPLDILQWSVLAHQGSLGSRVLETSLFLELLQTSGWISYWNTCVLSYAPIRAPMCWSVPLTSVQAVCSFGLFSLVCPGSAGTAAFPLFQHQ